MQGLSNRAARLLAIASMLLIASCQSNDPFGCYQAFEDGAYEQASSNCAEAYKRTGEIEYAHTAASASYEIGSISVLENWIKRLSGTSAEIGLWTLLARDHFSKGEYSESDQAYQNDFEIQKKANDYAGAATSLYGRAYTAWEQADYHKTLEFAAESFEFAVTADDQSQQINALYMLFSAFEDLGYHDSAEEVLQLIKVRIPEDDHAQQVYYLVNEGALRLRQERMSLARKSLEDSLELASVNGDSRTLRSIYMNLIEANLSLGDIGAAESSMTEALAYVVADSATPTALLLYQALIHGAKKEYEKSIEVLQSALRNDDITLYWKWQIFYEIGLMAEALDKKPLLLSSHKRAIIELENFRDTLQTSELRASVIEQQRQPYEALFEYYAEKNEAKSALDVFEKAKARAFLDAYVQALDELPKPHSMEAGFQEASNANEVLNDLLPVMSSSSITYPQQANDLIKALDGRNVLAYFYAKKELWVLGVSEDSVKIKRVYSNTDDLNQLIGQFSGQINDSALATTLGEILLPKEIIDSQSERLYIIPDENLEGMPFAALKIDGKFLAETHVISYMPSINGLLQMENRSGNQSTTEPVVIGDPHNDLPNAREEAKEIAHILRVSPVLGDIATDQVFYQSQHSAALHVATHSGFKANGPWLSLSNNEITSIDIFNNKIAPRLVTLASCASAGNEGHGLWGALPAAFLAAGSKAVLASLWTVDDESVRDFMNEFYLQDALLDPAKALAEAQRNAIKLNKPVKDWSSFVLLGTNSAFNMGEIL